MASHVSCINIDEETFCATISPVREPLAAVGEKRPGDVIPLASGKAKKQATVEQQQAKLAMELEASERITRQVEEVNRMLRAPNPPPKKVPPVQSTTHTTEPASSTTFFGGG